MTFLQPLLLFGLPLASLPIVIHLLNRQRHRTIPWAAMMFLIDAKRMTRGMARLRYWLIMAMRMLAIAGLIFAVSRPLASGWFGSAVGGKADTTILILDRSASMEQQDVQTGKSKRSTALAKLSELIETLGDSSRLVLIENTENRAQQVDSARSLLELPLTTATATSSDIVAMLQTALDYVVANQTGRTDIWVCSDLRENDWKSDDGRWATVRQGFERLEGIRFYLLTYPRLAKDNVAVRVSSVRRRQIGNTAELVLDVELRRESESSQPLNLPIEFVINGARSVLNVEMTESEFTLQGHTIPLDEATENGWGRVELPVDGNRVDSTFYFVFAEPPEHRTTIISDDRETSEPLRLAAVSPSDPSLTYSAAVLASDHADEIDWDATSLLLWQAPLPAGVVAQQIRSYVDSGRPVIFFPPENPTEERIFDIGWGAWQELPGSQPVGVASWRGDSDLLRHSRSGTPLPVGKLRAFRHCSVDGGTVLARFDGGGNASGAGRDRCGSGVLLGNLTPARVLEPGAGWRCVLRDDPAGAGNGGCHARRCPAVDCRIGTGPRGRRMANPLSDGRRHSIVRAIVPRRGVPTSREIGRAEPASRRGHESRARRNQCWKDIQWSGLSSGRGSRGGHLGVGQ